MVGAQVSARWWRAWAEGTGLRGGDDAEWAAPHCHLSTLGRGPTLIWAGPHCDLFALREWAGPY